MAQAISSSGSSSSDSLDKKSKKLGKGKKKDKNKNKKNKKSKKKEKSGKRDNSADIMREYKKQEKRRELAESWEYDKCEAIRLMRSLYDLDPDVGRDLDGLFQKLDEGESVSIDGLEDKTAKKKLRHLLQAMKVVLVEGQGFKSADKRVSFHAVYESCWAAMGGPPIASPEVAAVPASTDVAKAPEASTRKEKKETNKKKKNKHKDSEPDREPVKKPRFKGPMLPGATVGAVDGSSSSVEEGEDGPRIEGEERAGIDLRDLAQESKRENWMTQGPNDAMNNMFGPPTSGKADTYEVKRSKEEQAAFEAAMKRGPSLLEEVRENKFDTESARGHANALHEKQQAGEANWGQSVKEQERGAAGFGPGRPTPSRRAFDPEADLQQSKPMTSDQFHKLVESSQDALGGRFSRGHVATSFL